MNRTIELPGLVDMHVHFREPGYKAAEDFARGTLAALAGGVVAVADMPNNKEPITNIERLERKIELAKQGARTAIGLYFGATPNEKLRIGSGAYTDLVGTFRRAGEQTLGLKVYCDITTGSDRKHGAKAFRPVVSAWLEANPGKIVIAHTEGQAAIEEMIGLVAGELGGRIHIPHVSKQNELQAVIDAKKNPELAARVTAGTCPHYLFLTQDDWPRLGWYGRMKPTLGTKADQDFLRANIAHFDVVETDHAPHTKADKNRAQQNNPNAEVGTGKPTCFGVPGVEAMLPLLLQGASDGWITIDQIVEKVSTKPAELLGITLPESTVTVELGNFTFGEEMVRSKCGWSPYVGQRIGGRIVDVTVGGKRKVTDGRVVAPKGSGTLVLPNR